MQRSYQYIKSLVIRTAILLVLMVGSIIVDPMSAHACSCLQPGTPAEEFVNYDAIFLGRVTSVLLETPDGSYERKVVSLQIEEGWKGIEDNVIEIHTNLQGSMCGYHFETEQSYLVYASIRDVSSSSDLWTNICTRSEPIETADEDLTYLRANHEAIKLIRVLFAFIASFLE